MVHIEANGFQNDVTKLWCISVFNIETKEKLCFDLYYIKNFGVFLDIKILLKTLFVLTFAKGAK